MRNQQLRFGVGFRVHMGNSHSQIAEMVLEPGEREGGPDNRHRGSDQWLFVVSGTGRTMIKGKSHFLKAGTLLFIERGERHEIRNTGRVLLKTLNCYVPPAYLPTGSSLLRGRS